MIMNNRKPRGYWTKEKCRLEALKYKTRPELQKGNITVYNKAYKNGWIDEVCSHMIEVMKPNRYWTKDRCKVEALKYETRNDFRIGSSSAYSIAYKNGWLDEFFPKKN